VSLSELPGAIGALPLRYKLLILASVVVACSLYSTALLTTSTILPQMQGAMSATQDEIAWAMTFNILATAVVTPMTGWLVARFGSKAVMVWGILSFSLATLMCGLSQSLEMLVLWRIVQGGVGAPVVPPEPGGGPTPGGNVQRQIGQLLQQALDHFAAADAALKAGDLATYQAEVNAAQSAIRRAEQLAARSGTGSPSPSPSATPTASPTASPTPSPSG